MTASPSHTYTNDILGNRTYRDFGGGGQTGYGWDVLNRLEHYAKGFEHMDYTYRADGMRIRRNYVQDITHEEVEDEDYTMWYAYDGQMQVDSYEVYGDASYKRTSYGLGARGIDYISTYNGSSTVVGFPIYDGHGNMIATIGRTGSGPYYALGDQRSYDVWGQIRAGNTTGDPKMRYCANLGHPTDDESGLIYMRARYYEPWTGRFVSEDPGRNGWNWFSYSKNNPVSFVDKTGKDSIADFLALVASNALILAGATLMYVACVLIYVAVEPDQVMDGYMAATTGSVLLTIGMTLPWANNLAGISNSILYFVFGEMLSYYLMSCQVGAMVGAAAIGSKTAAGIAVMGCFAYSMLALSFLMAIDLEAFCLP